MRVQLTSYRRLEPFKFIDFPLVSELGLEIYTCPDGNSVRLSTQKPIKGLVIDVDGEDIRWSDQGLDLVPDDLQTVRAEGLNMNTWCDILAMEKVDNDIWRPNGSNGYSISLPVGRTKSMNR